MAKIERWIKDPDSIERIRIPWDRKLGGLGLSIATSDWTLPSGLTFVSKTIDGLKTTVLLSGGTLGEVYSVSNRILTSDSQLLDYTVEIEIKAQ